MTRPFVIFAAPAFSPDARRFIGALQLLRDVKLGVITREPLDQLEPPLRERVAGHWRIDDVLDAVQLEWAVRSLAERHGQVDRLLAVYEQLQVPLATVRERLGLPGMKPAAAANFRDKARMKTALRDAGVPCARHRLVTEIADGMSFSAEVGHSVVFKPPAGAGALSTFRVDGESAVVDALLTALPSADRPLLLEEYLSGAEHSLETVCVSGQPVWHSLTRYLPTPLEVLRHPWIQWCVLLPREVDAPQYDDVRAAAGTALRALGMDTGLTHTEWFRRPDGSIAISEIAARPPGAQIMTLISRAHDIDFHQAWAHLMVRGEFEPPERRYAAGAAYLRGQGLGVVRAVHGLEAAGREFNDIVVDAQLPHAGQQPSGSYEGEGYIIVRHPDTRVVERALSRLVSSIRVELG